MSTAFPTTETAGARQSWWSVLGWAAYLACSWTWCIGMFLPVLLVRDYGVWGFVVFAVPNVIGAGAMGWVLNQGVSERITRNHGEAIVWFMRITLIFQWFFAGWLLRSVGLWWAGIPLFFGGLWFAFRPSRPIVALAVWTASIACAALYVWREPVVLEGSSTGKGSNVVWLAPVCFFGFALCPYLDITFHKARSSLDRGQARSAFSLGFGLFFAAMILFTLLYAPLLIANGPSGLNISKIAGVVVFVHMVLQIMYTTGAFYNAHGPRRSAHTENIRGLDLMALLLVAHVVGLFGNSGGAAGLSMGELIYRCFMSFYGLVFPAYVWLCMIPTADGHSGIEGPRGRWKLLVLGVACTLAAPCYWMGFIERVEWWLAPGLGVVLAARLLVRGLAGATVNTST